MRDLVKFIYEMGQLKRVKRSGWWIAGITDPESVAEHSFRVAILGYILAHLEGADAQRTTVMCLFHDMAEARLNDGHKVASKYLNEEGAWKKAESRVFTDQTSRLPSPIAEELTSLIEAYEGHSSLEAHIAHDADKLECLVQAREYQVQGHVDVQDWIDTCRAALMTESAKRLADECLTTSPSEWWQGLKARVTTHR